MFDGWRKECGTFECGKIMSRNIVYVNVNQFIKHILGYFRSLFVF